MSEQFAEQADAVVDNDTSALDSEPSLVTDEDRMDVDPLEGGMDGADDYSREVKLGGTQNAEEQDTLAYRIPQEEPDPALEEVDADPGRPVAATPLDELDESIDRPVDVATDGADGDPAEPRGGEAAVEIGLDPAAGSNEPTGLPADDGIGAVADLDEEDVVPVSAEEQALRVDRER